MANKHPNLENLKKGKKSQFRSGKRAVIEGAKGGKKLGENNKRRKTMKEIGIVMANCLAIGNNKEIIKKAFPDLSDEELTNSAQLLAKIYEKALKGDVRAFEVFRDTIGEKPIDKIDNTNLNAFDVPPTDEEKQRLDESFKRCGYVKKTEDK